MLACLAVGRLLAQQAEHTPFGAGCHDIARESFAAWFADGATAAAGLTGQSLRLEPLADGYRASWGGATFRLPSAAAVPTPQGSLATLWVHSNGFVAASPANDGGAWNAPANDYWPSPQYRHAPATTFWAWHDWNPAEPGSGRIVCEEVWLGGERTLCVTWLDVENFPVGVVNRGTFQFQFGLASGRVAYVWVQVDDDSSSVFGSAHLVGYSPGGPSLDPGFLVLPADLPLVTGPDRHALALRATPLPVSTPTAGTTIVYTTDHVPPWSSATPAGLGLTALSLAELPGVDLGCLGAPGCRAYLASLDVQLPWHGDTLAVAAFDLPPGLPDGLLVFAQSLALVAGIQPGELRLQTSNGLRSLVARHR